MQREADSLSPVARGWLIAGMAAAAIISVTLLVLGRNYSGLQFLRAGFVLGGTLSSIGQVLFAEHMPIVVRVPYQKWPPSTLRRALMELFWVMAGIAIALAMALKILGRGL